MPRDDNDRWRLSPHESHTESTLTSLTPDEYENESRSGYESDPKPKKQATGSLPIYAKVNKHKKRGSGLYEKEQRVRPLVVSTDGTSGDKRVHISSEVFELSSEEFTDEELLQEYVQDKETPPPSSPVLPIHRPPPSSSPRHAHRSSLNEGRKQKRQSNGSSKFHSTPKKKGPSSSAPDLSDIPVYNLSQSFGADGGYVLSRTNPADGRVEYFTAAPILSPSPSPFSHQSVSVMQGGRRTVPVNSSTPMENNVRNESPGLAAQFHFPIAIPQTPVPVQTHTPVPILPTPLPHPFQSRNSDPASSSFTHQRPQLSKRLSSSQPSLATPTPYVGGLTEINQVLLAHEEKVSKSRLPPPITATMHDQQKQYPTLPLMQNKTANQQTTYEDTTQRQHGQYTQ